MSKIKGTPEKIQFRLDEDTMRLVEAFARQAGMTVNAFVKQAMLEKVAELDGHSEALGEIKQSLLLLIQELAELKRGVSLSADVILHMLAVSEIGDMTDQQAEQWVARHLPRGTVAKGGAE